MKRTLAALTLSLALLFTACTPDETGRSEPPETEGFSPFGSAYCVSGEMRVESFHVPAGEVCEFDPTTSSMLMVDGGSALVEGTLVMHPKNRTIEHRIRFEGVDTEGFKGGGMGPTSSEDPVLESDPGLWVMGRGKLDIKGSNRIGWTRNPKAALNKLPRHGGWWEDDELRITPSQRGDFASRPWKRGDPVPRGVVGGVKPEIFNLTRNVSIEGTSEGDSHVFIHSTEPQSIAFASFKHVGPACDCPGSEDAPEPGPILGRWALHWHHSLDGSRGSMVRGTVIRDSDSRGYVPHQSNGIHFKGTIAFEVTGGGYWWDEHTAEEKSVSRDILWHRVLASDSTGTGIFLASGGTCSTKDKSECEQTGNVLRRSVAAGSKSEQFSSTTAGIQWGSRANTAWTLQKNVSHNNRKNLFWWDNTAFESRIAGTTTYHGASGEMVGAYQLSHSFPNTHLHDQPMLLHASRVGLISGVFDMRGNSPHAVEVSGPSLGSGDWTTFNVDFRGYTGPHAAEGSVNRHTRRIRFVDSTNKHGDPLSPDDVDVRLKRPNDDRNDFRMRIEGPNGSWETTDGVNWRAE